MIRLGYCCINNTLKKSKISVNSGCKQKTFKEKGVEYISELVISNLDSLIKILYWNAENGIKVYRMSSSMFPWMSEYEIQELPKWNKIKFLLNCCGRIIKSKGIRVSFHPGPFNVLGSPNPDAVDKTIKELNQHSEIMGLMGLDESVHYPINIHCNGTYGNKDETLLRWCTNYGKLNSDTKKRLVVENDDKKSMYTVKDLYDGISTRISVPITFDYFHHKLHSGGMSEEDALKLAYSTWPKGTVPLFHYSSSKRDNEDSTVKENAHSGLIYEKINDWGMRIDIELEAKEKERSVFAYLEKF